MSNYYDKAMAGGIGVQQQYDFGTQVQGAMQGGALRAQAQQLTLPPKSPQVPRELDQIEVALEDLACLLNTIYGRIEPILLPPPPTGVSGAGSNHSEVQASLAVRLAAHKRRLLDMVDQARDIQTRIEL